MKQRDVIAAGEAGQSLIITPAQDSFNARDGREVKRR